MASAGLLQVKVEDATEEMAKFAARRLATREARRDALVKIEGKQRVETQCDFLHVAASSHLSGDSHGFLFHVRKPD